MVFHSVVHILSLTHALASHILTYTFHRQSAHCNGGNCKAISHFHHSLFLLLRKYHKSNYRLDWFCETFGWVSPAVDHASVRVEKTHPLTHTHQLEYIKNDMTRREYEIWSTSSCRPDAITKYAVAAALLYHCECRTQSRPLFIFLKKKQSQSPIHKIHFKFDWIHIFHSNPIVPIRYRRFLFVVYLSVSLRSSRIDIRGNGFDCFVRPLVLSISPCAHISHQFGFYANENSQNNLYFISIPRFLSQCNIANFIANTRELCEERRGKMQYKTNDYFLICSLHNINCGGGGLFCRLLYKWNRVMKSTILISFGWQ